MRVCEHLIQKTRAERMEYQQVNKRRGVSMALVAVKKWPLL